MLHPQYYNTLYSLSVEYQTLKEIEVKKILEEFLHPFIYIPVLAVQ